MDASLISIRTESESDYITEKIKSYDLDHVWLGGNDKAVEGVWM